LYNLLNTIEIVFYIQREFTRMKNINECPLCCSTRKRIFETIEDEGKRVSFHICHRCGLVYQSPRMDEAELAQFYAREYRIQRQKTEDPIEKDLLMQDARARAVLGMVQPHLAAVTRHLDVGSSSGALLQRFHEQYKCASVGVEPGDSYRHFSQSQGLKVFPSLDTLAEADENPFDLISMLHVIEHIEDPVHALHSLRESKMRPGGYLLLEVPNLIDHESLELSHLYAFTRLTLKAIVQQAGFRILLSKAHGSFRSPILNLYITMLAQAESGPRAQRTIYSSPIGIKTLRRLGKLKRDLFTSRFPDWTWQSPS
jgi:2-polyprenyl-3-methyl-5-hydroxy-6-metoxy-1,4-benzoquinol methylase